MQKNRKNRIRIVRSGNSIALIFTTASSFQILAGANVVFGCLFSRIFLKKRKLELHQWIAVFMMISNSYSSFLTLLYHYLTFDSGGVTVVGLGDHLSESNWKDNQLIGDILSLVSAFFYAAQSCYSEKVLKHNNFEKIFILGYKGAFNLTISSLMLVGFYFLKVPFDMQQPNGVMENALDGFIQLGNNPVVLITYISK